VSISLLAQLSDPHVRVGGDDGASARALAAAVAAVLASRPAPLAVLVSGDIADGADAREYERVRELLAPLPMPVHVLPGNHDDRDALREHFGLADAGAVGEPLQYTARCGDLRLIVCDTTRPGRDDGELRRDWLQAQLAAEPSPPTIVAMHHVPLPIGLPVLDAIGVPADDRRWLAELLASAPQVRRVAAGHVHRTVVGTLGGCGVIACTSNHLQARLEIGMAELQFVHEPPAFVLHALLDGELVSHVQPIGG
jgi:3',5'-cyclic-AMP phosphodiesterase